MTTLVTRLHITPFDPELFTTIIGKSRIDLATNVSYHNIQTFPELRYGYVDLPQLEAEKLKKKLDGTILKGQKMKISIARQKKRKHTDEEADNQEEKIRPIESKPRKVRKERNVLPGHEISPDREVKRGWTEKPSRKSNTKNSKQTDRPSSLNTEKQELLFRTNIPPNKEDTVGKKEKKGKRPTPIRTVHEFATRTTQPSFLRDSNGVSKTNEVQYVDGQGWVDEDGKLLEKENSGAARRRQIGEHKAMKRNRTTKPFSPKTESNSASSSSEEDVTDGQQNDSADEDEATSSSGISSESSGDETSSEGDEDNHFTHSVITDQDSKDTSDIHPLEALFKKPRRPSSQDIAKPSLEISTSFSFFDKADPDGAESILQPPGTPFSSQDMRSRGLRSAAPTPDTAYPSRYNSYGSTGMFGDEEIEDEELPPGEGTQSTDTVAATDESKGPVTRQQSNFEKSFWEKRGENNRAWKLRRRTVLKEKRHRENRARRPKNW